MHFPISHVCRILCGCWTTCPRFVSGWTSSHRNHTTCILYAIKTKTNRAKKNYVHTLRITMGWWTRLLFAHSCVANGDVRGSKCWWYKTLVCIACLFDIEKIGTHTQACCLLVCEMVKLWRTARIAILAYCEFLRKALKCCAMEASVPTFHMPARNVCKPRDSEHWFTQFQSFKLHHDTDWTMSFLLIGNFMHLRISHCWLTNNKTKSSMGGGKGWLLLLSTRLRRGSH